MNAPFEIRPPAAAERAQWLPLWRGYLAFYGHSLPEAATESTWQRVAAGEGPIFGLVASQGGRLVGLTHYLFHASSWTQGEYCYLEDLFVDPAVRGGGIGRALIEAVYAVADARKCLRVYWSTKADNARARALYDKLATASDFVQYRR